MISIAIDGPSGAGKSTAAKMLAARLHFHYVDTGALYRALGYVLSRAGVNLDEEAPVRAAIQPLTVRLVFNEQGQRVLVNEEDVTPFLRTAQAGENASRVSVHASVRDKLLEIQRRAAREYNVIMDGRDIGTQVLPQADLKVFITASVQERARRRYHELQENQTLSQSMEEIIADIQKRDERDRNRAIAPLRKADDATKLDTTHMNLEQVVQALCDLVAERSLNRS